MDVLQQLNGVAAYIEAHLCNDIDMTELTRDIPYTPDGLNRIFTYLTQMTLTEYIRKRRLTKAAYELRETTIKVIDIAVKYGYNSADAFTRAFTKQHGITPTAARLPYSSLKVYPPVSFHLLIKGADEMNFKIVETPQIVLHGISKHFTGTAGDRFEQEHVMWADHHDDLQNTVCATVPGIWYGVWNGGVYAIAKREGEVNCDGFVEIVIPEGRYAVFTSSRGGFAGEVLPKLREQVFNSWLADSGYRQADDFEVEIYHLFPKTERSKRWYELWVPVVKA